MKVPGYQKTSRLVLWGCMLITLCIFLTSSTHWLILWLYCILGITTLTALLFSVRFFIKSGKANPKRIVRPLGYLFAVAVLLGSAYLLGSGNALNIPNYRGAENSYQWLKVTDMWIYSIYFLLALVVVAILSGIVWSYLKKGK